MKIHLYSYPENDRAYYCSQYSLCGGDLTNCEILYVSSYLWHLDNPNYLKHPLELNDVCQDCKDILPVYMLNFE